MNLQTDEACCKPIMLKPQRETNQTGRPGSLPISKVSFPPIEIVAIEQQRQARPKLVKKSRAADYGENIKPCGTVVGVVGSSGRSIASSITITDREDLEDDLNDLLAPFSAVTKLDSKPFIPRRQNSSAGMDESDDDNSVIIHDTENLVTDVHRTPGHPNSRSGKKSLDNPPTKPRRSRSFASGCSSLDPSVPKASSRSDLFVNKSEALCASNDQLADSQSSFGFLNAATLASSYDKALLAQQAAAFRAVVPVKDHKYGIRRYKQCFNGSEAIDRILEVKLVGSRQEAVDLGRRLMATFSLFQQVSGAKQSFKDNKKQFYRFKDDRQLCSEEDKRSSNSTRTRWFSPFRKSKMIEEEKSGNDANFT